LFDGSGVIRQAIGHSAGVSPKLVKCLGEEPAAEKNSPHRK
jgi:hypothetical protein